MDVGVTGNKIILEVDNDYAGESMVGFQRQRWLLAAVGRRIAASWRMGLSS